MTEGITCYERDEALCEDQMCLRVGCRIRNEREHNRLLAEQTELLRQALDAAKAAAVNSSLREIRERARRNTPWGCKPPTWAR